jgi:hypothetical protein
MNAGEYTVQLQQDFQSLGLDVSGPTRLPSNPNWINLVDVLQLTRHAGSESHRRAASENPRVATALGKHMLDYGLNDESIPFRGAPNIALCTCCSSAEGYLVANTNPEQVANGNYISPVVVVKNDEPISIIKGHGERTSYGVSTDLTMGVMAGAFSQSPDSVLKRMRHADKPFYIDISEHGAAQLLRVGGFLVPVSIRRELTTSVSGVFPAHAERHEELVARAYDLLEHAEPLPPVNEKSVREYNREERERAEEFGD